jgi:hypothetical protein
MLVVGVHLCRKGERERTTEHDVCVCVLFGVARKGSLVVAWVDDVNVSGKCLRWSEVWGVEVRWVWGARAVATLYC